ncbi:preprotein translocase subunit YajC [Lentilactobacillus sp. SPB1-3]|uniref:Preprotein translocase subunit YajC n=1 Tax=Lentilactobacillus terminaliae TaxID=3003483 RepID=A0ACD5DH15_9LACO
MIVVLFGLMYFFMIRPQRKQEQKRREELSRVKPGDQVVTIGRLHGVVDEINNTEKTVTLDCDGIYLVFDLSAIAQIKQPAVAAPAASNNATVSEPAQPADDQTVANDSESTDSSKTASSDQPEDNNSDETK